MFDNIDLTKPAGIFTTVHIISLILCVILIAASVFLTRKMSQKTYFKILKVFAIVVTVLEIIKIISSWKEGRRDIYSTLPLYFCSIYIYALWLTYFKNTFVKNLGLSYIAYAAIIAGFVFLVFPTSSFTLYPIFHFKCIHSMVFHSMMVYSGIMLFVTKSYKIQLKSVLQYMIYGLFFMILAIILNNHFGGNFMFVSNPGGVPLKFLYSIYKFSSNLYTIVMVFAHVVLMPFAIFVVAKLFGCVRNWLSNRNNNTDEEVERKMI